jgi:hypothetical protein
MTVPYAYSKTSISLAKLILQESGTYNPVFSRPYISHVDNTILDNLSYRLEQNQDTKLKNGALSGLSSSIVMPSPTHQGEVYIPNGWNERRIRFVLEVHCTPAVGNTMIYYFQGFTTHLGVTAQGNIDPNMDFVINSFIRVTRTQTMTQVGVQYRDVVTDKGQVINGQLISQGQNMDVYGLRATDVYAGIQSGYLNQGFQYQQPGSTMVDTRYMHNSDAFLSNKADAMPSHYVGNILENVIRHQSLLEFGAEQQDLYSECRNSLKEATVLENPFMRCVKNVRGYGTGTTFSFGDLMKIDPNVKNNAIYNTLQGTRQMPQMGEAGQMSYWNGADRNTLVATMLGNAVPALMMDLLISKIVFRSTNQDMAGMINTVLIDAKSISSADMRMNYENFIYRFNTEVMYDLTFGNQDIYQLEMQADMFGDTFISLSLNGGPMVPYNTPSFCDSLMTPVITGNSDSFFKLTNDFETMFNSISLPSKPLGLSLNTGV